jgi:hypothetical protein
MERSNMNVLSGLCRGGPKDGQSLATMQGRRVTDPRDASGLYVWKAAAGTTPSTWQWIKTAKKDQ